MGKNQDPGSGINIPDPPHCGSEREEDVYAGEEDVCAGEGYV